METKLTLRLDDELIKHAKARAERSGKSLSKMVGDFFALLDDLEPTSSQQPAKDLGPVDNLPPVTRSLVGILTSGHEVDDKRDYRAHVEEKYR